MPSAKKTPNYNLTQYADNGTDKVSFMGDYNADMSKIDTALNNNANNIITKADKADTYSKTDVDTKLSAKADSATTYSKTDVDSKLGTKADAATTYSKSDVDSKLSAKANASDVYSKTESDANFATSNAVLLKANASDVYSKTIADKRFAVWPSGLIQENIIILGDSISYGTGASDLTKSWANMLGAQRGATVTNLAQNNAGYTNAPTFATELSAYSGDKSAVTHIIIAGGANDKLNAANDVEVAAQSLFASIKTNFPNAKVYVIPCVLGFFAGNRYNPNIMTTVGAIETALSYFPGMVEIPFAWEWLGGNESWSSDFSIHPNDAGNAELLRIISNCMDSYCAYRNSWTGVVVGANNNGSITHGEVEVSGGIATCSIQLSIVNGPVNAYSTFCSVSNVMSYANNSYVPNSINQLVYTYGNDTNQDHRCSIASKQQIADGTEIYLAWSKAVAA